MDTWHTLRSLIVSLENVELLGRFNGLRATLAFTVRRSP